MKKIVSMIISVIIIVGVSMNIIGVKAEDMLQVYYSFDNKDIVQDESGNYIIKDLSGNGYNIECTSQPNIVPSFDYYGDIYAIKGECIEIQYTYNAISLPLEAFENVDNFTMNFWLGHTKTEFFRAVGDEKSIVLQGRSGSGITRFLTYSEYYSPLYEICPGISSTEMYSKMHMYTIVKNDNVITVYFDGKREENMRSYETDSKISFADIVSSEEATIALYGGQIDEFRLYSSALNEDEIRAIYEYDMMPVAEPTKAPTSIPTLEPTSIPTIEPKNTEEPTTEPTLMPTLCPTLEPEITEKPVDVTQYSYEINGVLVVSNTGDGLDSIPQNSSFIVDVAVTKTQERNAKDFVFVAVYNTDGALLSLDYVKADFPLNAECSFGFNVPGQEKQVGSIKAYVWNSFTSPVPLAESKTIIFN